MSPKLTAENFRSGFLIDDECMAGITEEEHDGHPSFSAFVLNHVSGEYLGYRPYKLLIEALDALSQIPRDWVFESTSGCGGERCGEGKCKGSACKLFNGEKSPAVASALATCPAADGACT